LAPPEGEQTFPPTWDALPGLHLFRQNWLHPHLALRFPTVVAGRRYDPRTPAMALGLIDYVWTWQVFLATPAYVSSSTSHSLCSPSSPAASVLLTSITRISQQRSSVSRGVHRFGM